MEKHSGKSGSFIGRHRWRANLESPRSSFSHRPPHKSPVPPLSDDPTPLPDHVDHDQVLAQFHRKAPLESPRSSFSHRPPHKSPVPPLSDLPDHVDHEEIFAQLDAFIANPDDDDNDDDDDDDDDDGDFLDTFSAIIKSKTTKSSLNEEDASFLFESAQRLSKVKSDDDKPDKMGKLLHRIMVFMEEELRSLLADSNAASSNNSKLKVISSKHFSFKTERNSPTPTPKLKAISSKQEDYPGFSHQNISKMNKIATTMISAGYKNDCSNVYSIARGNAFYDQLRRLHFQKLNAEEVHKFNWDSLEPDIARWIRIINHSSHFLIPAERRLGEAVFSHHLSLFRPLFVNLVRSLITSLLDYAATVATLKRSAERLFKFLDMYEALLGLREAINRLEEHSIIFNDFNAQISSVADRIGEGVVNMFGDLEKSIRQDGAKTPVPGGAVHPLTRYVLNYLKYACDYGGTLEQIFHQHNAKPTTDKDMDTDTDSEKSPLAAQIASVMSLLDGNLAVKSTLYKDPSLRDIFLMNNGRYILQKVKGSNEIKKLVGDNWCRRRSSEVRHYHKSYQRETWARLLQCITQEGIQQVNGKVNKKVLKERFKNFNVMFDEIHKTQSPWVVSEEQLQSELRASISAVVIPAYRSFLGRYKHHFEARKNMDKYIKYQPEDIEALIETLFEGNPSPSMSRKRF